MDSLGVVHADRVKQVIQRGKNEGSRHAYAKVIQAQKYHSTAVAVSLT